MNTPPDVTQIDSCIDDLTGVLADRPAVASDQRETRAGVPTRLIEALEPQDAIQTIVASQAVLFNALTMDAAGEILRGMDEPMRPRARSNAIAMGRLVAKHLDTLIDLQGRCGHAAKQEEIPSPPVEPDTAAIPPEAAMDPPEIVSPPSLDPDAGSAPGIEVVPMAGASRAARRRQKVMSRKLATVLRRLQTAPPGTQAAGNGAGSVKSSGQATARRSGSAK